ncbi:MAG TPA: tetratricopeptide repeat protein [Bacteroidia bacterium]|nr:tetratricopeptide repeat protein [Bacteroidia bacterium]
MYKLSKHGFPLIAFASIALLVSSCGTLKKTGTSSKVTIVHRQLTRDERDEVTADYFEASKQRMLGNYDRAIDVYMQCLKIEPDNAAADFQIADIYEFYKKPDTALVYANRAALIDPANIWYQDLYAQCLQDKGRYKDMEAVYEGLIKNHPDETDYYYKLALAQIEMGEYEKAADTYGKVEEKLGGFSEEITREKIKLYETVKDFTKAEVQIQSLITVDTTNVQNYVELADLYDLEGKHDESFKLYQDLELRYPHEPSVRLALAEYYRAKKNDKRSFEELDAAFKEPSMDIDSKRRILLSFNSVSNGHDSLQIEALELCSSMVQAHPNNPEAHRLYGDFLFRQASYNDAREQYRYTVSEDSSKYLIWSQLMGCDIQLNDFNDLAKVSSSAMELFPNDPQAYLFNGVANNQKKNYTLAVTSLSKGLDYVVNDNGLLLEFYSALGDVYNSLKRYSASDSAFDAALKLNPNNDNILNNYSYYLSERDTNLALAEQMSKRANDLSPDNGTYLDTYAWIFYKEGNYQNAKTWEDKSLAHGGEKDAAVLDHYGDIVYKLGDKDTALDYWQKAKSSGLNSDLLNRKIQDRKLYDK